MNPCARGAHRNAGHGPGSIDIAPRAPGAEDLSFLLVERSERLREPVTSPVHGARSIRTGAAAWPAGRRAGAGRSTPAARPAGPLAVPRQRLSSAATVPDLAHRPAQTHHATTRAWRAGRGSQTHAPASTRQALSGHQPARGGDPPTARARRRPQAVHTPLPALDGRSPVKPVRTAPPLSFSDASRGLPRDPALEPPMSGTRTAAASQGRTTTVRAQVPSDTFVPYRPLSCILQWSPASAVFRHAVCAPGENWKCRTTQLPMA